ncbi:hypothetical protein BMETH_480_1 [methanotrophic bacterial endosymbiont of Bathymodiolus sp.]|nr:hypothetical protein BMETH_480_1 [methanotrophic bacterial endosymbiont of Bathymodiolus sp.]
MVPMGYPEFLTRVLRIFIRAWHLLIQLLWIRINGWALRSA